MAKIEELIALFYKAKSVEEKRIIVERMVLNDSPNTVYAFLEVLNNNEDPLITLLAMQGIKGFDNFEVTSKFVHLASNDKIGGIRAAALTWLCNSGKEECISLCIESLKDESQIEVRKWMSASNVAITFLSNGVEELDKILQKYLAEHKPEEVIELNVETEEEIKILEQRIGKGAVGQEGSSFFIDNQMYVLKDRLKIYDIAKNWWNENRKFLYYNKDLEKPGAWYHLKRKY